MMYDLTTYSLNELRELRRVTEYEISCFESCLREATSKRLIKDITNDLTKARDMLSQVISELLKRGY